MRYGIRLAIVVTVLSAAAGAVAQQRTDAAAHAAVVARFVDGQTIGVAHVDLSKLKIESLFDETADFIELGQVIGPLPRSQEAIDEIKTNSSKWLDMIEPTGIKDVYLLITLEDFPNKRPVVIVPLPEAPAQQRMAEFLLGGFHSGVHKTADVLVACDEGQWSHLSKIKPVRRPELTAAFQAAGDSTAQLLVLPTADARRVVEELLPKLPDEIGGAPSTVITHGARWVAVGVNAPPGLSIRFVAQSMDQQAAAALRDLWVVALRFAAADKALRKMVPTIDEAAQLLTPRLEGDRLTLRLDQENEGITALATALRPPVDVVRRVNAGRKSINNLKMMAIAMHAYHESHKHLPDPAIYDADGKPLLSWRVHVLPYVDQNELYKQFHLDEPWDSDHNRALIERMPDVYRSPESKLDNSGRTNYVFPTGKHALFSGLEGPRFRDITDGMSNTLMTLEVNDEQAVVWTKPDDLPIDPENPLRGLGGLHGDGFCVGFADGSARFLPSKISADSLRSLFTPAGGEPAPRIP